MAKYAENTNVSSDKSKTDIERALNRFGADGFIYAIDNGKAAIMFRYRGKHLKFVLDLPDRKSRKFTHTETGRKRKSDKSIEDAYESAVKRKWRALYLTIKASLVSVDDGIKTFEQAFLGNIILPNGKTVDEMIIPQIEEAYESGNMPPLLTF